KLSPGDMVIYTAGTYKGSTIIDATGVSGTEDKPIVFLAMPGQKVTFNASKTGINIYEAKHVVVDGFVFDNTYGTSGGQGISMHHSQNVTIRNIETKHNQRGIFGAQNLQDIAILDSVIHNNNGHGMYIGSRDMPNSNITVKGNLFYENATHGMQHNGRVKNLVVEDNVMHSNSHAGLSLIEGVSDSYVRNNVIFNNNKQGIIFYTYHDTPSSGVKPYPINNNVVEGNVIWVGKNSWQGNGTSPTEFPAIQFNDSTGVGMNGNIIRNNTLVSYRGPVLQFNQSNIASSTRVEGNDMWRAQGTNDALRVGGSNYGADRLNNFNSLFKNNTFKDPQFKSASVDYYNAPEKFNFVRVV
ncbi:MAG: right-handed parallel beta-helix repeat-containing protein, partial [Proteiniphilum sp.]